MDAQAGEPMGDDWDDGDEPMTPGRPYTEPSVDGWDHAAHAPVADRIYYVADRDVTRWSKT